jgi:ParB family chromosome partitioning protein
VRVTEIPVELIDISDANTRKDLKDGQVDSTIEDLARSIDRQGLLNPISAYPTSDGRYALVAGQRRLLAFKHLGRTNIPVLVHDAMSDESATAVSLVENVHRADMNPRDKAVAFKHLVDLLGGIQEASSETGVGQSTIRKYVQLLALAPSLQESLAAGEAKNTQALAKLAQRFPNSDEQEEVWGRISGFRQDIQLDVIGRVETGLDNLGELVDQAAEGGLGYSIVRNCPHDCPTIPDALKAQVAAMLHQSAESGGAS